MNYNKHFLTEDIPQAKAELSCLTDLCGMIAVSTHKGNIAQANMLKDDLLNSLKNITELHEAKRNDARSWLKWKQIQSEQAGEAVRRNFVR